MGRAGGYGWFVPVLSPRACEPRMLLARESNMLSPGSGNGQNAENCPFVRAALAEELVGLNPDVLVVSGNSDALAFRELTNSIPIVMSRATDPVQVGLVASLARPGGNITGLDNGSTNQIAMKRLQMLKESVPGLLRVGVL